jgi:hypothetical protein
MLASACPLVFDPQLHAYTLQGVPVPSVTQVLKATGYIRLDGIRPDVLEHARDRGQRVHQALQFFFEDDLDESSVDGEVLGYVTSARRYIDRHVRRVLRAEMRLWSTRHGFAGTADLLAVHVDGHPFVGDFKTGDPSDVAADLQLAAYLIALLEMRVADADLGRDLRAPLIRRRSIRLYGDGRMGTETQYSDSRDATRFLNALNVVHDLAKRPLTGVAWDDER